MLADVLEVANSTYTLAGSMEFDLNTVLNFSGVNKQEVVIDINTDITTAIAARKQLLEDCQIEMYMQYKDSETNKVVYGTLPYIMFNDNIVDGSIQLGTLYANNQILVSFDSVSMNVPADIKDARIIYNVYSKQEVTIR